jgi:hypothetical protein
MLALVVAGLLAAAAVAGETVTVDGSNTRYPTVIESKVSDKPVKLNLTGAALRKKYLLSIYTVGSYLQDGADVKNAEDLVAADVVKQLQLVMERDVNGKDLAASFQESVRLNHRSPEFDQEVASLVDFMKGTNVKKGDQVWLTHVPGVGFHANVAGRSEITIKSPAFAKAVWEIYLGKKNIGAEIKEGLVSRL